jgi:hypothetical protein
MMQNKIAIPESFFNTQILSSVRLLTQKYGIPSEIFQIDITHTKKRSDDMWLHSSGMAERQQCASFSFLFQAKQQQIEKNERDLITATTLHPVSQSNLM